MPSRFKPSRFKPYFLVKQARMTAAGTRRLLEIPADVYHAHDVNALLATSRAARRKRKLLILDAHELPFVEPAMQKYKLLIVLVGRTVRRIAPSLRRHHHGLRAYRRRASAHVWRPARGCRAQHALSTRHLSRAIVCAQTIGLPTSTRIALYQGIFQSDRGLDDVVRAGKIPPTESCARAHGSAEGMERRYGLSPSRKAWSDRVKFLPIVPYS